MSELNFQISSTKTVEEESCKAISMSMVPVLNEDGTVKKDRYGKIVRKPEGGWSRRTRTVTYYFIHNFTTNEISRLTEKEVIDTYGRKAFRKAVREFRQRMNKV